MISKMYSRYHRFRKRRYEDSPAGPKMIEKLPAREHFGFVTTRQAFRNFAISMVRYASHSTTPPHTNENALLGFVLKWRIQQRCRAQKQTVSRKWIILLHRCRTVPSRRLRSDYRLSAGRLHTCFHRALVFGQGTNHLSFG